MTQVVHASVEHIEGIEALELESFHSPLTAEQISGLIRSGSVIALCAVEDGRVTGYVSAQTVLDEGYINNIAVAASHRRRGIGRALLEELSREAVEKKLSFLTLEVRESNSGAIALYECTGYGKVGLRKNYYEKPRENAIIMTKFLK